MPRRALPSALKRVSLPVAEKRIDHRIGPSKRIDRVVRVSNTSSAKQVVLFP
jgi:hypothetical protein